MTEFGQKVLAIVSRIPKGQVMTYKEVADLAGRPGAFRAVGNIMSKNHDPSIPCHRVVRSDGQAWGYNRGRRNKIRILDMEGVKFQIQNHKFQINLKSQ